MENFNIINLSIHSQPLENTKYFIDANIWIIILKPQNLLSETDEKYFNFFEEILETKGCKIVACSLVFSEIINTYVRKISYAKYLRKNNIKEPKSNHYKSVFRKTSEFISAYNILCDDIKNYHNSVELINDSFGDKIKWKQIMISSSIGLDFNDLYYGVLCKINEIPIITDDGDFWIKGISIYTLNRSLIQKDIIVPVQNVTINQ